MNTLFISIGIITVVGLLLVILQKVDIIRDRDGDLIPDVVEDVVKDVKVKAAKVKKEVNRRAKNVKNELSDVKKAVKEVGNQVGDVTDAVKGKSRRGRKPKARTTPKTK
jgi:gas vesicle protein